MDSDDCILNLKIIYKEKSFNISSEDIITINEIKEEAIKNFNIMDKDKNNIKLFLKKGQKDLIISSENDIIQNADDSDINNPKLDINLLIESKEESISKEEPISKEDKSILQNEQISKNISKINNISEEKLKDIKNENEIKYNELKIIIEKMSNEIKILKEDQINKHKILENNNINIKNEIEGYKKQFEIININNSKLIEENAKLKEEINKINEVNKNAYKNLENLFRIKCMEISDFKNQIIESFDKYIKEFKLNYENKKNEIKSDNSENILNLLKNKIEENINNLEQKYNNAINSSINDLEKKIEGEYNNINAIMNGVIQELFKKINENKKEIRFLKESSINLNNINKTNKNMIIDEGYNESNINNENKKINNKNEFSLLDSSKNILNNSKNFDSKDKENLYFDNNEVSLFSNNNPNNKQKMIIGQKQDMDKIKELRNKFKEKLKDISDEKLQELLDKYGEFDSSLIIDFNNE